MFDTLKRATAKRSQRIIGSLDAALVQDEDPEQHDSQRRPPRRPSRYARRVHVDQPVNQQRQSERRERSAADVDAPVGGLVAALGDAQDEDQQHDRCDRQIDHEDVAPGIRLRQPSADDRSGRRGERGEARPQADRAALARRRE